MTEVTQQAIADISGRAGNAAQRQTQCNAGCGLLQSPACRLQRVGRQCNVALQCLQRQSGVTQRSADVNVVTGAGATAQQGLCAGAAKRPRGHLAEHGDADVQRALRGVATNQFAAMGIGQGQQTFGERLQPVCVGLG